MKKSVFWWSKFGNVIRKWDVSVLSAYDSTFKLQHWSTIWYKKFDIQIQPWKIATHKCQNFVIFKSKNKGKNVGKNVSNILVWNVISNFFYQIVVKIKTEVKHTLTMRHYIANFPIETKSINFHCALKLSHPVKIDLNKKLDPKQKTI